ncbi:MAG: hypothetical protein NC311_08645 [Muribaculaceae bacterium]|nr:hypothetical protein [Muribaculaceae bacterium]MCM1399880.1 hypothetical protein [Clostridium sp.]MCM1460634.1 hypothetical protein [Bacteroides sp.]
MTENEAIKEFNKMVGGFCPIAAEEHEERNMDVILLKRIYVILKFLL